MVRDITPRPGLEGAADILGDLLTVRGVLATPDSCLAVVRTHCETMAVRLNVPVDVPARHLDVRALRLLADAVAREVDLRDARFELSDPAQHPLDQNAAPDEIALAHRAGPSDHNQWPVLCVRPLGELTPELLMTHLAADVVTASFEAPTGPGELATVALSEHPHLTLHLNPGTDVTCENCTLLSLCAKCDHDTLTALLDTGQAVLRAHLLNDARRPVVPVRLHDPAAARRMFNAARARLLP